MELRKGLRSSVALTTRVCQKIIDPSFSPSFVGQVSIPALICGG
jgi:hypothetical protein